MLCALTGANAQRDFLSHSLRRQSWLLMGIQPITAATEVLMLMGFVLGVRSVPLTITGLSLIITISVATMNATSMWKSAYLFVLPSMYIFEGHDWNTAVVQQDGGLFFLNGPGGTGKTFVYQALSHAICHQGKIVLCVASSGNASILLPGGQTSHSCFRIQMILPIATYLRMALKQSSSSRLLQLFGMKFQCNIGIAWKQWITLWGMSLTVTVLLVVLWCSGEGTLGKFSQWLRRAVEKTLCLHASNTHTYGSMWGSSIWLKICGLGRVQRNRPLHSGSSLLVREPMCSMVVWSILHHLLTMWELVEVEQRKPWRVFWMQLTQVSPTLSQDHQGISQRGQSLLLAMKQWMSSTTAFLPSSLGWPAPLQAMTGLSMRLRKGGDTMLRTLMQGMPLNTCTLWDQMAFQRQNWHSKWDAQWCCCAIWILPKVSVMEQGYWSLAPPHMSLRVAFWEVNIMESQHSFLGSPYTHIRVTLPSSLNTVNSQFALPLQWQSTKAKDNLSSMWELTCILLFSHMANSMLHSQGPLPKIRFMFYFHKGKQGLRLRM